MASIHPRKRPDGTCSGHWQVRWREGGRTVSTTAPNERSAKRIKAIVEATGTYTDELAGLTSQEQKILKLVAEGQTNKEIAAEVFLSDKTVKNYVSSILSKLNLERRAQAAAFVAKHRIDTGR